MRSLVRCMMLALICFCLVFCACSLKKNASPDPAEKVVSIGGQSASLALFKALYETYLPYMQYYGQDPLECEASLESYQDWLLDSLTGDIVTRYQAEQAGFELSAEQEAALKEQTDSELDELYDKFMRYAEQSFSEDASIPVDVYFDSLVNSESEHYTGIAMNWEEYKEYYREESRNAYIVSAFKEQVCGEFLPSEEEIRSWYENALDSDKANYADSPEKYRTDEELFETSFGEDSSVYPITYVPEGYSRIMHIVVSPEGELPEDYETKLDRMDEIKAEYADLAFEDAISGTQKNTAAMSALLDEYMSLKEESDAEYDAYVESARNKIYMAYGELESGKPFADVMLKYTEDERVIGTDTEPGCEAFQNKGELISLTHRGLDDWSANIIAEFSKLEKGEYSGVFMDGGSYHIVYYASDEPAGEVPLAAIHDVVETVCAEGIRNAQWDLIIEEWKNDPDLKINMDLIRQVGREDLDKEEE